jgi:hypothetical protein
MSATVSVAPPYGNLLYGKLLDTLVAKDALSTGPIMWSRPGSLQKKHALLLGTPAEQMHDEQMKLCQQGMMASAM